MIRKTSRQLAMLVAAALAGNALAEISFKLVSFGADKSLKFNGVVSIEGVEYGFASDSGKLANFPDVDAFLKKVSKFAESGDGMYAVTVETSNLLASSVPSNIITANAAKVVSLGKVKTAQQEMLVSLDAQLALMVGWATGNAAQRSKLAETQAQRDTIAGDIVAIDAEVASLT